MPASHSIISASANKHTQAADVSANPVDARECLQALLCRRHMGSVGDFGVWGAAPGSLLLLYQRTSLGTHVWCRQLEKMKPAEPSAMINQQLLHAELGDWDQVADISFEYR